MREHGQSHNRQDSERGAALLSVLMIVVAMSIAAVTTIDALARSVSVSRSVLVRSEAMWAIRSAEALGASYLEEIVNQTSGKIVPETPGLRQAQVFSTPRFNVTATLMPAGDCFNLNALAVSSDSSGVTINETAHAQYLNLLRSAGFFEGEVIALGDTIADWMDSDDVSRASGAESRYYGSLDPSYRPGGQMLENMSELNAISGYSPDVIGKLSRLICVYPTTTQNKLNINNLAPDQAPLLHALFSEELSVDTARSLIESRPVRGWLSVQEFMELSDIQQIADIARMADNIEIQSKYFEMQVDLISEDQTGYGEYLFEAVPEEGVRTIWRREGGQR